jgi:hypothetical protein
MRYELSNGVSQRILTKEEHPIQTAFFDATEVVVLLFMLSLSAHFAFWSRIVSGLNQERA